MGCCASTNSKAAAAPQHHRHSLAARSDVSRHSKAAPPPEEETVKEVLSETPTPKPPIPKIEDEEKMGSRPPMHKIREEDDNNVDKKMPLTTAEEASEVSEICSLSESLSTVTEKREDDGGEVQQRVDRPPAKFRNRAYSGERRERTTTTTTVGRSPARRSEPSPGRVRSVAGRERRAAVDGGRRDLGESSGRRSRSPATRTAETGGPRAGMGRSPSGRKTGKSPARERSELQEKTRKPEETKWPPSPTTNESLENPLVSLECFIFL